MAEIVAGSIVQLLTGGPKMTVELVSGTLISCTWFPSRTVVWQDGRTEVEYLDKPNTQTFYPAALKIVE